MRDCSCDTMRSSTENINFVSKVALYFRRKSHTLAESYEYNQENCGNSLTSQGLGADVVPAKHREEVSAVPTDKSPGPVEIRFVGDDSVGMVNHFDGLTCHMDRLPNEILTIIIYQVSIFSNFSWPHHRCHVYNQLCKLILLFRIQPRGWP